MRSSLYAAFAFVVIAGCASASSPQAAPSSTTTSHVRSAESTSVPTRGHVCVHHPIAREQSSYYGFGNPGGTSIDFLSAQLRTPVVDGHGNTIETSGAFVKHGPDGTITLVSHEPGGEVGLLGWGDFDGDGRSDLLVDTPPSGKAYVVPGTLTSGTYDPAVVGFPVPDPPVPPRGAEQAASWSPAAVGDQNRDGADDISVGASLYSGRQITASRTRSRPLHPFRTLSGPYAGLLQIGARGAPPSFLVAESSYGTVDILNQVAVLDRHSDQLMLDGITESQQEILAEGYGTATGWLVHGHHIVQYGYSDRSGETAWRFDLDAACAP